LKNCKTLTIVGTKMGASSEMGNPKLYLDSFLGSRSTKRKAGGMNIYVGNLSLEVTEDDLRQEFVTFGEVISVVIMNNKYIGSGQPNGYGYVQMASKSEGQVAVTSLKGKRLRGRVIDVIEALPLSDSGSTQSSQSKRARNFNGKARQRRV